MSGQLVSGAEKGAPAQRASRESLERVEEVFERCNKERPRREDIAELKSLLRSYPDAWREGGDLAVYAVDQIVDRLGAYEAVKLSIKAGYAALRRSLGYDSADSLERCLIEAVSLSHLRLQLAELQHTQAFEGGLSPALGLYHEKRLSHAQRRYLRACGELARVRHLLRRDPVFQVNIAESGAQVLNVGEMRGKRKSVG